MHVAVCGKGGSGKSTVSWLLTQHLARGNNKVLAVDADYNMDLAHNLGWTEEQGAVFISQAEGDFYEYQGLTEKDHYVDLPAKKDLRAFSFHPHDSFTEKLVRPAGENVSLMIAGPTHPSLLYGHRCSHAYVSPLKYYLPLLKTECPVVIDSVAGTDMVSYGMYLGVDAVVVVVEPTPNSMGVFRQISEITGEFGIPTFAVLNKFAEGRPGVAEFLAAHGGRVLETLPADVSLLDADWGSVSETLRAKTARIWEKLAAEKFDPAERWNRHLRWRAGYERQLEDSKKQKYTFVA